MLDSHLRRLKSLLSLRFLPALFCAAGLLTSPARAQVAGANNIVINEMAPTTGGDHAIELYNYGPGNQSLTGWTLTYDTDTGVAGPRPISTFTFPTFTLNRHAFVEVHWSAGTSTATDLYTGIGISPYTEGQLILKDNLGAGVDYVRFGTPFYNGQPADLSWWSNAIYNTSTCQLYRNKDLNTRVSTDWTNPATCVAGSATAPTYGALNPGQVGTRRHGKIVINEFYLGSSATIPWIELYNPSTSTVYLTGGKLEAFDDNTGTPCFTYTLTSPNTYFIGAGLAVAIDLPATTTCTWLSGVSGGLPGQIRLTDSVGEGWDYVAFNNPTSRFIPSGVAWTGGDLDLNSGLFTSTSIRKGDLDSDNSAEWKIVYSNTPDSKGTVNTTQTGDYPYDEFGSESSSFLNTDAAGAGWGTQVDVDTPFLLREYKVRLTTTATQDIHLVVRKYVGTTWTLLYDLPLNAQLAANGVYSTGPLATPIHIDSPASYLFMVYSSGPFTFYRSTTVSSGRFAYGTVTGYRKDAAYPPTGTPSLGGTTTCCEVSSYLLSTAGPDITTPSLPNGEVNLAYSQSITRTGGTAPFAWSLASGTLPPGLALSGTSNGLLSGTPTLSGTYNFSLRVTDTSGTGVSETQAYTVTIYTALAVTNLTLIDAEVGFAYSRTLLSTGGSGGNIWSKTAGPAWMAVSTGGSLTGVPLATGTATLGVSVTDSIGATATRTYNTITVQPAVQITTVSLPNGQPGVAYNQTLARTGGVAPFTWSLTAGDLPHALSMSSAGQITGSPLYPGVFSFTVQITDLYGAIDTQALTITVIRPLSIITASLPNAVIGIYYINSGGVLLADGGTGPYTFALAGGSLPLPPGITLSAAGVLNGAPTTTGVYPSTYQVTDSLGATATRALTLTVINKGAPTDQWRSRGLHGGKITKITASPNYATDQAIFALGGRGQYFVSGDGAENWTGVTPDPLMSDVTFDDIRLAPNYQHTGAVSTARQTLLINAPQKGVLRSTDRGATWSRLMGGFACAADYVQNCPYLSVAFSPNYGSDLTLWMVANSTPEQVYKSVSGGAWTLVANLPVVGSPKYLTLSPAFATDGIMYFADSDKFYRSRDGGLNWSLVLTALNSITDVKISPDFSIDRTLMVETYGQGVYVSRDRGDSFTRLLPPQGTLTHITGPSPVKPPSGPVRWYLTRGITSYYKLIWTDDGGETFSAAFAENIPGIQDQDLEATPVSGGRSELLVFGGWYISGILKSDDDGLLFDHRDKGVTAQNIHELSGTGATVVALGDLMEWFKSGDTGAGWVGLDKGTTIVEIGTAAVSPNYSTDGVLFFGGLPYEPNLERSDDGGQSFTQVMDDTTYGIVDAVSLASNFNGTSGTAFVVTRNGLWKSTNGGQNFTAVTVPATCFDPAAIFTRQLKVSPNYQTDGTVFMFAKADAICKGTAGGTAWTVIASGMPNLFSNYFDISPTYNEAGASGVNKTIFYISYDQLFKSTDGGAIWTQIPGNDFCGKPKLSPRYNLDATLFIYNDIAGNPYFCPTHLQRSVDYGVTFTPVGTGSDLHGRAVKAIYLPPTYDGRAPATSTVVVGTSGNGIFRSTDDGLNYVSISDFKVISKTVNAMAQAPLPAGFTWQQWLVERAKSPRAPGAVQAGDQLVATSDSGIFQSTDGGMTYAQLSKGLPAAANTQSVAIPEAAVANPLTGVAGNGGLYRYNGTSWSKQTTAPASSTGNYTSFLEDGTWLYATNSNGVSLRSSNGGTTWLSQQATQTNLINMSYNASSSPTLSDPSTDAFVGPRAPSAAAAVTASLWAVNGAGGPLYSPDSAVTWIGAPGTGDYIIPGGQSWRIVQALGINPVTTGRDVIAGTTTGLWKSNDGGATWKNMSGPGSGLESTSKNFASVITSTTAFSTTDVLVGAIGSTTGGVYLSGDGGEHWMQINQGFDPNSLNITTLVKTSCSGCPVNYYTGTYGSGVYTRTIAVNNPPAITGWCFGSTGCACGTTAASGPESGGQAFRLCGSNFLALPIITFDGLSATGCTMVSSAVITCTATPIHWAGPATVRVRNTDTRTGVMPPGYSFTGSARVAANTLRVAKSANDAVLTYTCTGCTTPLPQVYRSQNNAFTLNVEVYTGGADTYTNTGALAAGANSTYFWNVE